jgi:hypothetical protein
MQQAEPTRAKSLSWMPLSAFASFPMMPAAENAHHAQAVAFLMINAFQGCGKLQQCLCVLNIPIL